MKEVDQFYNDFKTAIQVIAENLGVAASHVYEILVRQQLVESLSFLAMYLLIIPVVFIIYKCMKHGEKVEWEDGGYIGVLIVSFAAMVVLIVFLVMSFSDMVTGFINPEYGAIMEIKNMIK